MAKGSHVSKSKVLADPLQRIPSTNKLLRTINATNTLLLVVRGHQCVEAALNAAISEALPHPHAVEISRLSFALKADLAVGLGVLRADSRPAVMAFNKIRNDFAHTTNSTLTKRRVRLLYGVLSPFQRHVIREKNLENFKNPKDFLGEAIAVFFIELRQKAKQLRDDKIAMGVMHEMIEELRGHPQFKVSRSSEVDKEFAERMRKKKAEYGLE